ncbi:hypothetical protein GOP47_0018241 [Adiantum capillus-veneris]|uniref:MADS-box domain-containing protein n=1 Tax=Adiantum capillus-veneris TaxID=13818 RepID=A0A9D4UHW2_ADICA|nr:hypothetical protein GOP47_0018241 [Adiantum capillus-veneris]
MGKSKTQFQKIEKDSNRRVTFNKRRIGLLKKAYEISVLCEVDIALIFFGQNGEMTCFEGPRSSIEEVVMEFARATPAERTMSHVQKYITNKDEVGGSTSRNIENEEMFQEVARGLYESSPRGQTCSECDRAYQMEICHGSFFQDMMKEIRNTQCLLSLYDLNMSICNLISANEDALLIESYVRSQLQRIQDCKQRLPEFASHQLHQWINGENNYRGSQVAESYFVNQELASEDLQNNIQQILGTQPFEVTFTNQELATNGIDNNVRQILIEWDDLSTKLGELYNDQIQPPILSQPSEDDNEILPSSIEDDIDSHDFLDVKSGPNIWE